MIKGSKNEGPGLIVMAKLPGSGKAKTRLRRVLTRAARRILQTALVEDALAKARMVGRTYLAFTPQHLAEEAEAYHGVEVFPQMGDSLGERMANVMEEALGRGHDQCIVIGTDCPYLTVDDLRAALACLRETDVCLGPALDGGYYLIGLRRLHRGIFVDVPWSSQWTLATTLERITALGLRYRLLRSLRDLDTSIDLCALVRSVMAHGEGGVVSPRVCALLTSWYAEPGSSHRPADVERPMTRAQPGPIMEGG